MKYYLWQKFCIYHLCCFNHFSFLLTAQPFTQKNNMFLKRILAGLTLSLASAAALAAPWSQTIDFGSGLNVPTAAIWTHDLGSVGFRFGSDQITSFSLSVRIIDRAAGNAFARADDLRTNLETAVVDLPGGTSPDAIWFRAIGTNQYIGSQDGGVLALNSSGKLSVSVDTARLLGAAMGGNFAIAESTLTAQGVVPEPSGVVPEPSALALVCVALLGVGLSSRRQVRAG